MEPGYKTVDHIEQLDFSKLIGGPKVDFFDMILSSGPKEVTVDLDRHLVDRNCKTVDPVRQLDFSQLDWLT